MSTPKIDVLKNFDHLPDSAVVHTDVTVAITGLSDRTVRRVLPRVYLSVDRYGQRVSDIRNLLAKGADPATRRIRVGPAATRLIGEVQAAATRAEGEKIIGQFDRGRMADDERERLRTLLADALAELPE
jgi:hypothetical protein